MIFPATATLIEKHEREEKERRGQDGRKDARAKAGVDATGAFFGSIGLASFALVVWKGLSHAGSLWILMCATLAWCGVSLALWRLSETVSKRLQRTLDKGSRRKV